MNRNAKSPSRRPAIRRSQLLESLENRQMLAAFSASVNFQPSWAGRPAGYLVDSGKTFSNQGSYQYGWNRDNSGKIVDRHTSADARYDTFAYIGGSSADRWEIAVPNGQYRVNITAGDPSSTSAHYVLRAENSTLINETPSKYNRWSEGSGTVTVNDGRLTITSGGGAWNNKINSVSITQVGSTNTDTSGAGFRPPAAPAWASSWSVTANSAVIGWGDSSDNEQGFIIEQSSGNGSFREIARVPANTREYTVNSLSPATNYQFRVKAYNARGSVTSALISLRTGGQATPSVQTPAKPAWVSANAASTSAINVSWNDASWNENGFIVWRSTNNSSFYEISRVGANVSSFTDTGLQANTNYYYRITAFNGAGSVTSTTASGKTNSNPNVSRPDKPDWVSSWASGANNGSVNWGDSSYNESGFIIERSTDNRNFSEIGRVGANTTIYNVSGLNASTKYYFRVSSFNSAGTSDRTAATSFTTWGGGNNGGNSGGNTGGNTGGSNGSITNKYSLSGISANTNGDPAAQYKNVLEDVGIKNVRIWYSFKNWNAGQDNWYINRALDYKRNGYTVMLAVLNPNVPSSEGQAKAFFERLASNTALRNAVDYWQINNETNMPSFWYGSASQYVNLNLRPAYQVLKGYGETVVGAGPSWDVNAVKQLVAAGYNNYCDYSAFHPYGETGDIVVQRARDARAAFNNKPMMVTEWNIQGTNDTNKWITELNKAAAGLSNVAYMNYYFALKQSATHVGSGGLLKYDGSRNSPFYNAVKGWLD